MFSAKRIKLGVSSCTKAQKCFIEGYDNETLMRTLPSGDYLNRCLGTQGKC